MTSGPVFGSFLAGNTCPRRTAPCPVPESTCRTPPRGLPGRKICPRRKSPGEVATSSIGPALNVANPATAIGRASACCTTSAIWSPGVLGTSTSPTPSITAADAASTSTPTRPTWPRPRGTTPIASLPWPCDSSPRTAYPIKPPAGTSGGITVFLSPSPPSRTGWRPGGKKAASQMDVPYLDWALADFSGYIAADELYDGPFCILSIVDNRTFKRLLYQVLDHDPDHPDITAFLRRFQAALVQRDLLLKGVTTDASPLYPKPLRAVFGEVPHQICEFHILKELTKAILRAVAKVRKRLAERKPTLKRGRPSTSQAKRAARQRVRLQQRIADLFEHRHLFVQHDLTAAERRTLQKITRGLPQLRTLRDLMEEVYRLFDRRCRSDTALAKLTQLRQRVRRFKAVGKVLSKLHSSNLEKALTFLDDKLLPSTSNAVERGNRRHRKMQKTVYRVRTQEHIHNRIALDLLRDSQKHGRTSTLKVLHRERTR